LRVLSRNLVGCCEDFGLRWQSAAATPPSSARPSALVRGTLARAKAAWRFASRRRPKKFGCGSAALRLGVKIFSAPMVPRPNWTGSGERDRPGCPAWRPAKWNVRRCLRRDAERGRRDARAPCDYQCPACGCSGFRQKAAFQSASLCRDAATQKAAHRPVQPRRRVSRHDGRHPARPRAQLFFPALRNRSIARGRIQQCFSVSVFICVHLWLKNSNWFHRSADCANPQHAARQINLEIIPVVSGQSTRCELGQLALRCPSSVFIRVHPWLKPAPGPEFRPGIPPLANLAGFHRLGRPNLQKPRFLPFFGPFEFSEIVSANTFAGSLNT